MALIVNGFVRDVLQQLPMEFMAETQKLIGVSLEGIGGMMADYWFKPHDYGYGATPSLEGLGGDACVSPPSSRGLGSVAGGHACGHAEGPGDWQIGDWADHGRALTLGFVAALRGRRPMDEWGWRWGK